MPLHLVGKMTYLVGTVLGDDEVLSDRQPINYIMMTCDSSKSIL